MKLEVDSNCSVGAHRANNEDAIEFGFDDSADFFWMVVADGMGGHKAGEVASAMLVGQVKEAIESLFGFYQQDWSNWIKNILEKVNRDIYDAAENNSEQRGMGTTGVMVICYQGVMYVGWVGDSRAYLWRQGEIKQLTRDHSAINYLLDKGSITEEEARESDSDHLLARAVGSKKSVLVDLVTEKLATGDMIMLSTDGLHDYLPDAIMQEYLSKYASGQKVADRLVDLAIAQGSQDNLTLGIARFQ